MLNKFNQYICAPNKTSYDLSCYLRKCSSLSVSNLEYARVISGLIYLMTRPFIEYAVGRLMRYTNNNNSDHGDTLFWVWRYLRYTLKWEIQYIKFYDVLKGNSDNNWILDTNESKSMSGYMFTLVGSVVSLWSKPLPTIFVYCDGQTTIFRARNSSYNKKSKHIHRRHNIVH